MKPRSAHEDQPITMSGGSLRMLSGGWTHPPGNPSSYDSSKPIKSVSFRLDIDDAIPNPITYPGNFTIEFTHGNGNHTHSLLLKYVFDIAEPSGTLTATMTQLRAGNTTSVTADQKKYFFDTGDHPKRAWKVNRIWGDGSLIGIRHTGNLDDFFLQIEF